MSRSAISTAQRLRERIGALKRPWQALSDEQKRFLQGFLDRHENMNQVNLRDHDRRREKILAFRDQVGVLEESLKALGITYSGEVLEGRELEEASAWTNSEARRAAFHEAGHAVAAYLGGCRLREVWIAFEPGERRQFRCTGGHCRYAGPSSVFTDLAGYAAEQLAGLSRSEDEIIESDDLTHYRKDDPYYSPGSWQSRRMPEAMERLRGVWTAVHALATHLGRSRNWLSGPEAERLIESHLSESAVRAARARRQSNSAGVGQRLG